MRVRETPAAPMGHGVLAHPPEGGLLKYTLRAVLAVAMLVGVYVLGVAVVAALVALVVGAAEVGANGALLGKLVLVTAVIGIGVLRGLFTRAKRDKDGELPGVPISPEQQPRLWAEVRALAQQAETRPPDEIRLVPEVNAAVSERSRWLGLVSGTRSMCLGVPLLTGLTALQLRSVMAHELGHYSGNHGGLGGVVYRGREAIVRVVHRVGPGSLVGRIFTAYGRLYVRVSHGVNRRQELEADQLSARLVGPGTAAAALREVGVIAAAWSFFVDNYAGLGQATGRRPVGLLHGFVTMVRDPERQKQLLSVRQEPPSDEHGPYDTHPSAAARIRAFEDLPGEDRPDTSGPALALLDAPDEVLAAVEAWMYESSTLLPTSWDELVARAGASEARDLAEALVRSADEVEGAPATLGSVLQAVSTGRVRDDVRPLLRDPEGDVDGPTHRLVSALVADAVVTAGSGTFALNWGGPMRLSDAAGQPLEVSERVARALADADEVEALRSWLVGRGVSLDHRPELTEREPAVEPDHVVAAACPIGGAGYRFLLVTPTGVILRKPEGADRRSAALHSQTGPGRHLLDGLLKRRDLAYLRSDRRSVWLPWTDIDSVTEGRSLLRRPQYTIRTRSGASHVVKMGMNVVTPGDPVGAIQRYLGNAFQPRG